MSHANLFSMISALDAVSLASVVGGGALAGHWLLHQRDALGRPRAFPVWSVALLVALAVAAAVPGVRRRTLEGQLSRVATTLAGHPVKVHCQSFGQALTDLGSELGYVKFTPTGPERSALIKRDACGELRRYAGGERSRPTLDALIAVHVLTHEAMHMRGLRNEAETECAAVQRNETTAKLLGASADQARALARAYWKQVYPRMPSDYVTRECAPGGRKDEGLVTAPWAG